MLKNSALLAVHCRARKKELCFDSSFQNNREHPNKIREIRFPAQGPRNEGDSLVSGNC